MINNRDEEDYFEEENELKLSGRIRDKSMIQK